MTSLSRFRPHGRILAVLAGVLTTGVVLAGCASTDSEPRPEAASGTVLADRDLDGLDARELIEQLDTMPVADRPDDLIASVRPDELVVTDEQDREDVLPMPADEFYVSVAPYVDRTHDCFFHSLTTCLGELAAADVRVIVTDSATGATVLDEARQTYDNGFVGLWLPRGLDAELTIEYDGRSGTVPLSTSGDDPTCVTSLQLA